MGLLRLLHSTVPFYVDDTSTGTTGKTAEETIEKMEEDAQLVLKFMASNGLVANAKKNIFSTTKLQTKRFRAIYQNW